MQPYYEDASGVIYHGDCIEVMENLPDCSVQCCVTSPPYNLLNSTGNGFLHAYDNDRFWRNGTIKNGYKSHEDNMPHEEYVQWQQQCLSEMMRLITDNGAIFYNHKWRVQGGLLQDRNDIVGDFPVRQIIIWKRAGGLNFNDGYFVPTYEVIYLICKPHFKLLPKQNKYGDVWEVNQERDNEHPAPFPEAIPIRCLNASGAETVLDPFAGSGTTLVAAKKLNRRYIGIELAEQYCEMAAKRLIEVEKQCSFQFA